MRWVGVLIVTVFLSGCQLFSGSSEIERETVYEPIFPPKSLTIPCSPEKPENISVGDLIIIQQESIRQCNSQLRAIRDWRERQEEKEESSD